MITGDGKSDAAIIATQGEKIADIARDSVALIRDGNSLYGRYDPGAIPKTHNKIFNRHKLDIIAYCLSKNSTEKLFNELNLCLHEIDDFVIAALLANKEYPAFMAPHFFNNEEYMQLIDCDRRYNKFMELTEGVTDILFVVVPWMPTVEDKANLYDTFKVSDEHPIISLS